jgi:hypothetical protein
MRCQWQRPTKPDSGTRRRERKRSRTRSITRVLRVPCHAMPGGYGTFRLAEGTLLRHHRREWFPELPAGFEIEESVERDWSTMNGNPARIAQLWCRKSG